MQEKPRKWTNMYQHVMIQVFSHLTGKDKSSAALTCKSWYQAFLHPGHWTSIAINLKDLDFQSVLKVNEAISCNLKSISIDCF
ncbi:F-box/LRR-repeat protein 3, partial [Biomphalaria glabrata]